jgi:hypothetical protein
MDIQMKYTITILLLGLMVVGCVDEDICQPDTMRCDDERIQRCDDNQDWITIEDCLDNVEWYKKECNMLGNIGYVCMTMDGVDF